jgi:nucleoside-diphosphate-sugar epimerase
MRVLVAGHRGFIGKHVVAHLAVRGFEIVGVDWPDDAAQMCEIRAEPHVDAIVNLAAVGGVGRAAVQPVHVMTNNVGAAVGLRRWGERMQKPPIVVQVSSFSVYGDAPIPTTIDAPLRPKEIYGASKLAQELCWTRYPNFVATLRLSSVYGRNMRLDDDEATVVAKIARAARDRKVFNIYSDGKQQRDFVHVADVCSAIEATLVKLSLPARVVNVCSGEPTSIIEACEMLGAKYRVLGVEREGDMRVCLGDPGPLIGLIERPPRKFSSFYEDVC